MIAPRSEGLVIRSVIGLTLRTGDLSGQFRGHLNGLGCGELFRGFGRIVANGRVRATRPTYWGNIGRLIGSALTMPASRHRDRRMGAQGSSPARAVSGYVAVAALSLGCLVVTAD